MQTRRSSLAAGLVVAALCAVGCTDATRETVAHEQTAIVGGTVDTGDPAVVAITHRPNLCGAPTPTPFCSGVLIAPRVVLTAAHCLVDAGPSAALQVFFGGDVGVASGAKSVVVIATAVHPGYDRTTHAFDVAVLRLADDPGVTPAPMGALDAGSVGASARVVGFGVDGTASSVPGVKRQGVTTISSIEAGSFRATPGPGMTCSGDSGGPVLISGAEAGGELLVGVTAAGDGACKVDAFNVRVDAVRDFIDPFVAATKTVPTGMPASLVALPTICSQRCTTAADCPAGLSCDPFGGGTCLLEGLVPAEFSDPCSASGGCAPGTQCVRVWPTGPDACRCATPCKGAPPIPIPSSSAEPSPEPSPEPSAPPSDGSSCAFAARGSSPSFLGALALLAGWLGRRRSTRPAAR